MSMRTKTTFAILAIVIGFTAASFFLSLSIATKQMAATMEQELSLALDIADTVVTTKISLLKSNAETIASRLDAVPDECLAEMMATQLGDFADFDSLAIYDRSGLVADYGGPITPYIITEEIEYMEMAIAGTNVLSSPHYSSADGNLVMHVFVPMDEDRVLYATMPGTLFSDILSEYRLWQNGSIFLTDKYGTFVASYRPYLVKEQRNFIEDAKSDPALENAGAFYEAMVSSDRGSGTYTFEGVERMCVYKHVSGSLAGWYIGVTAPLNESPLRTVQNGLLMAALFFLVAGVIVSFFVSGITTRPYKIIQEQAAQLKEEHERTLLFLDSMPLSGCLIDRGLNIFRCNEGAARMFRLDDRQEFIDSFYDFSPEFQPDGSPSREMAEQHINEAFEKGECVFEWMHLGKDGAELPTETTLIRIIYDGEYVVAGFLRDLREHKQMMKSISDSAEQLEAALNEATRANEAKSSFLANMSHEMRTPLNAIVGLTDLTLRNGHLDDESYRSLEKINNAGMSLLSMVNDLLDISKIEAGKFELVLTVYDVPSLINDTATQSILYRGNKPIELILDIDEALPSQLYGDELRVKQILNNLLSNAFKYTNEGTVTLSIGCDMDGETAWITASVRDTGIGVRSESLKNIFDNYAQMDMQANRKIMGTGLGLSITKRLVDLMDGTIRIESEYGVGSVFTARIPQKSVNQAVIGPETADSIKNFQYYEQKRKQDSEAARASLPDARVLIVDDVVTNLDVAKGMMKPYGMAIDCAASGQEAVDAIAAEEPRYDAVFMDHMMPGMDGIEAAAKIREIGTEYAKTIPIIALTANVIAGNEEMFLSKGFQAFISKPIEMSRLDAVVNRWIRGREGGADGSESANDGNELDTQTAPDRRACSDRRSGIDRRQAGTPFAGLDMDKGIERFGGDKGIWFQILRSYTKHTRPLLEKIEDVTEGSLADYAIVVHGIKGSSRGITAEVVASAAEKLEKAANEGDFAYVSKHNPKFLDAAWKLIHDLEGLIADADAKSPMPEKDMPDVETLSRLLCACRSYDMDGVDDAMAEICNYSYGADDGLAAWLAEKIKKMDFKEAIERLSGLV